MMFCQEEMPFIITFKLWKAEALLLKTPSSKTNYIPSLSQTISTNGACLWTYMIQMPPFISPLSVSKSVVHRLLTVAPISAWLKHTQHRERADVINIPLDVEEATSDSDHVKDAFSDASLLLNSLFANKFNLVQTLFLQHHRLKI